MIDVDYIMSLIDWNQSSEKQKTGIQMAKNIQSINVFLQPCNKNYNKNVWDNCAQILSERTDDMAQLSVQTATTEFVDDVRTTGKLSLSDYEQFLQTITATGNAFDVELEIKHLDENPGQKTTQAEVTKIGENIYYNEYTSQIMDKLEDKGYIRLKEGDMFSTTVKNTNTTIAQQLRGFFYKIAGNENAQVAAKHGGVVSVNGSGN